MVTYDRVRELFDYREDGELIRKVTVGKGRSKIGMKAGCLGRGYFMTGVDGKLYKNHRLIWLWHYGYFPENLIDHIDRNAQNNRIENLREVSGSCNLRNTGNPENNTSGVKGICWNKNFKRWIPRITVNSKLYNLGRFEDFAEAVAHRLAAEQCLNWEGCDINSPAYQFIKQTIGED